jgi:hypothetical protein
MINVDWALVFTLLACGLAWGLFKFIGLLLRPINAAIDYLDKPFKSLERMHLNRWERLRRKRNAR